jgi:hypothetical protein
MSSVKQTEGWCHLQVCVGSSEFSWKTNDDEGNIMPVLFNTYEAAHIELIREHAEDSLRKIEEFERGEREAEDIHEESEDIVGWCLLSRDGTRWIGYGDDVVNNPQCAMGLKGEFVPI